LRGVSKKRRDKKLREWQRKLEGPPDARVEEAVSVQTATAPQPVLATPREPLDVRLWAALIPVAVLVLLLVLNFRPIMQNDFWMHLKIGEDILDTFQIPTADSYSAVAEGRPFIAHEWMSGVLLALVGGAFGAAGFAALGALVAASLAALLFFALPKDARSSFVLAPLGALAAYLTDFRLVIRPDLFTMLLLAVWAFSIERWRRTHERWILWMLVPLVTAWANLHGAFLFGVVTLWGMAGLITVEHFLRLQRTGEPACSREDMLAALSVAGLAVVACLLNPRGWHLPMFSLHMTTGQAFEQVRAVTEWQPTFDSESYFYKTFPYLVRAQGAWLLVLWAGILLRVPQRPLFDFAIAGVATYISVRQNRFIPYAAIFGLPIAVRSWHGLIAEHAAELQQALSSRVAKIVGAVLVLGFTGVVLKRGYPLGPENNAALGWGFGSRQPAAETAYIKEQGLSGVLYNERMPDGAYLIRELYPAVRVVMDMRLDVYGPELCDEYDATKSSREGLTNYVYKYGVNLALVNSGSWLEEHFQRNLGFRKVFTGADRSVLTRQ
jgi:hypothetical protein